MLINLVVMDMVESAKAMLHTLPGHIVCLIACKASYWPVIQRLNWYIRQCIEYDRRLCRKHNRPVPRPVLSDFMFCRSAFVYAVASLDAPVTLESLRVGMRRWKDAGACDLQTLLKASVWRPSAIGTLRRSIMRHTDWLSPQAFEYAAHECAILGNRELLCECVKSAAAANIRLSRVVWYAIAAHQGGDYADGLQGMVGAELRTAEFMAPHRGFNRAILETVLHDDAVTMEELFRSYDVNFANDVNKDTVYRFASGTERLRKADACLKIMKRYNY